MYKVFDYCESLETLDFPSNVFFFGDDFQGNPRPPITYLTGLKTITLPVLCFVGTDKFPYDERQTPVLILSQISRTQKILRLLYPKF